MLRVSRESVKRNSDGLMRSKGLGICIRSSDHIPLTTFQSVSCKLSSTCNLASPPTQTLFFWRYLLLNAGQLFV